MSALLFFRPLFGQQLKRFALALLLTLVTLLAGVALLGVSGWFLTAAALTTAAASFNLFGPSALVRGLSLMRILSRYGEKLVGHDATLRLLADIRAWLFAALFPRVPLAGRQFRHGDLVSRLTADVEALDVAFLAAIGPFLTAILLGALVSVILFSHVPLAALLYGPCILAAVVVVPAALLFASKDLGRQIVEASAMTRTAVLDGIEGHADLIALNAVDEAAGHFADASARLAAARRRLARLTSLASAAVAMLASLALIGVLFAGVSAVADGTLSGPLMVGLLLACLGSFEACGAIVRSFGKFSAAIAAAERLRQIANAEPPVVPACSPVRAPENGTIAFEAVSYGYDRRFPVLRDVSLHVEPGERVAIVGASGCGKSTLLSLLLRLADPQAGVIRFGGMDLRSLACTDWHRHVAFLSQDTPVFRDTIRENLSIGRPSASDAELWEMLETVRLAAFVRGLQEGLDTVVGESGRTLSAGQARRLCLARTLLSHSPIIALDEPTSGLDPETELDFLSDLEGATAGRTVILVTHADIPAGSVDRTYRLQASRLMLQ